MKSKEIVQELNSLIETNKDNYNADFIQKTSHFLLNIIKTPFDFLSKFSKKELIRVIKKDMKLLLLIAVIVSALAIFILVLWFSISILIGTYFYDKGYSIFNSVLFSVLFQIGCIIFVSLIAFIASKRLMFIKLVKKVLAKIKHKQ